MTSFSEEQSFAAHALSESQVLARLNSNSDLGLTESEAQSRLAIAGPNSIEANDGKGWFGILLEQFRSMVVWVLFAAAILSLLFGDWIDAVAIGFVIVINAIIGFSLEFQAVRSMEALKNLAKSISRVVRDGQIHKITSDNIVPGDILVLETGDVVTADSRILENVNLAVKESALTGESIGVSKITDTIEEDTPLAERKNMLYKGTIVTRGNARAIAVSTGKHTELGKISKMVSEAKKATTPLEKKLNKLSNRLIILTLIIASSIVLIGVFTKQDFLLMLETAIALAVAAIPEGLPIVATIALARGMLKLSSQNVIVKNLQAVETLGEVDVICTDKTGTLTEDDMAVSHVVLDHRSFEEDAIKEMLSDPVAKRVITASTLCNNAEYFPDNPQQSSGDPLEIALLRMVEEAGVDYRIQQRAYQKIDEIPFDSGSKYMATMHSQNGHFLVSFKGALEVVLQHCSYIQQGDEIKAFENGEEWLAKADGYANEGLRILAFACKDSHELPDDYTSNLVFLGFVAFLDPPRDDVKPAIENCQEAGIRVIMVTGDHPETARTISYKTGIANGNVPSVLLGTKLEGIEDKDDDDPASLVRTDVFARVNPAQKLKLIELLQRNKHVVAMTGDGVNDAPALKKADIGIAMGIRGTEAAREAADFILKDDSFSSIISAVKQGRVIFENIRHFVVYLLSCNISEILIVAIASFAMLPLPLLPLQILFLNIVTDVFPALALGMGKGESGVLKRPPRDPGEAVITRELWISIITYGLAITISIIGMILYAQQKPDMSDVDINNLAFYSLILCQLWNVFNIPERDSSFWVNTVTRNIHVWLALLFCIFIGLMAYVIPPVREALSLELHPVEHGGIIMLFSLIPVVIVQLLKRVFKIIR